MPNKFHDYLFCSFNIDWSAVFCALSENSWVLQLPGVDPNDPSVKDLLASMQNQSEVSLSMKKNILDLKGISFRKFQCRPVNVNLEHLSPFSLLLIVFFFIRNPLWSVYDVCPLNALRTIVSFVFLIWKHNQTAQPWLY